MIEGRARSRGQHPGVSQPEPRPLNEEFAVNNLVEPDNVKFGSPPGGFNL